MALIDDALRAAEESTKLLLESPALTRRALDDIHRLAVAAEQIGDASEFSQRIATLDGNIGRLARIAEQVEKDLPGIDDFKAAVDQLGRSAAELGAIAEPMRGALAGAAKLAERVPGFLSGGSRGT
jgi:hypothetical protein